MLKEKCSIFLDRLAQSSKKEINWVQQLISSEKDVFYG